MTKRTLRDLAILGGSPLFDQPLHVGRPNLGDREKFLERVNDLLDRRWLTNNGPYVQELESKLASYFRTRHCIVVSNGTIGLEITARALGLSGEVIIPSFTFVATAHALQWQEITPIFCDTAPGSHHIDPEQIERHITPRTSAILGVHVWGEPCDTNRISEIARRNKLKVFYDAAHAFGCSHNDQMIGNFGDAEVFSFHATKLFNTFEGGAIATNSDDLAEKIRFMRNFGFAGYDDVQHIGINGKMPEICAAMGLTMLEQVDSIVDVNRANYARYAQLLGDLSGVKLYQYGKDGKRNYQYVIIEIDEAQTALSRDALVKLLHTENILVRRYFYPGCHSMEPYRSLYPHAGLLLPNTIGLAKRVISLPTGTAITTSDIEKIADLIRFLITHSSELKEQLAGYLHLD